MPTQEVERVCTQNIAFGGGTWALQFPLQEVRQVPSFLAFRQHLQSCFLGMLLMVDSLFLLCIFNTIYFTGLY